METNPTIRLSAWDYWVEGVLSGNIPVCALVRKACERHVRDIERSVAGDPGFPYRFDERKAARVVKFFGALRLTKGLPHPGRPFRPEPWQQFILVSIFGWVHKETGLRRFRKGHAMVPRKNGKSHLYAGIGLYCMIADGEMGADVYSVATKKDQAKMIWDAAVEFRRHSGDMAQKVGKSVAALFVRETSSKFMALASEEDGLDGLDVHCGLVDELQNHKTDAVYERMVTGTSSRRQPLLLSIATAGVSQESPCWREHEYASHVLLGDFADETYFAFIAEADEADDWESEETWKKCNLNLGVSKTWEYMRTEYEAAKNQPAKLNAFLRLDLNRWTQQDTAWMPMHKWRLCSADITVADPEKGSTVKVDAGDKAAVEDAMLAQWRPPFGGLDLSEKGDITSLTLLFPPCDVDPQWVVQAYHFVPEDCVEKRAKNDRVPYDLWIREGRIMKTPGAVVDYDFVRAEVLRLHRKLHLQGLAVDPHNALMLNNQLRGEGVPVVEVQQGWKSLSDPTKELMAWVLGRKLNHLNDPVMNWMMGNVAVWQDAAGNIKPDKAKARERIDGVAAMVNAIYLALSRSYSVYSSRGLLTI